MASTYKWPDIECKPVHILSLVTNQRSWSLAILSLIYLPWSRVTLPYPVPWP